MIIGSSVYYCRFNRNLISSSNEHIVVLNQMPPALFVNLLARKPEKCSP
ncbi:hypothetical protein [Candidatus Williamhamiltonella defendens]